MVLRLVQESIVVMGAVEDGCSVGGKDGGEVGRGSGLLACGFIKVKMGPTKPVSASMAPTMLSEAMKVSYFTDG